MNWSSIFGGGGGTPGAAASSSASNTNNFGGLSTINPIVLAIALVFVGLIALRIATKK